MWQMNADGTIQLVNTSFCLDVSGKTSAGGLNVVIEKCQSGEYGLVSPSMHACVTVF